MKDTQLSPANISEHPQHIVLIESKDIPQLLYVKKSLMIEACLRVYLSFVL